MKYKLMQKKRSKYSVEEMCKILKVSKERFLQMD